MTVRPSICLARSGIALQPRLVWEIAEYSSFDEFVKTIFRPPFFLYRHLHDILSELLNLAIDKFFRKV